ncbi:GspH/FimT family pseudopilin [Colwelliaceae bacterium BS250]
MKKLRGITLIELLITILIMSILASIAGPSFLDSFKKRKLINATEQLYSNLQLTRSEALSRSIPTYLKYSGTGSSAWFYGISQTSDCDPSLTSNANASACMLIVDNGDGNYVNTDDNVLHTVDGSSYDEIVLRAKTGDGETQLTFNPMNGTIGAAAIFSLTNSLSDATMISVSIIGNIKICSSDLGEYRDCP